MDRGAGGEDEPVVVTPVDRGPDGDDEQIQLGSGLHLPRWMIAVGAFVLIAGAITAVTIKNSAHHRAAPTPLPSQYPQPSPNQRLGTLQVQDLAINSDASLYILRNLPPQVVAVGRDGAILNLLPAPPGARLVIASPDSTLVWVIAPSSGYSAVFTYASLPLRTIGHDSVPANVFSAAALKDQLWLATDHGVYVLRLGAAVQRVPGFSGHVQLLAADPARNRLIGVSANYDLLTVDRRGVRDVRRASVILPESIAVTKDAIWAIGFGLPGTSRQGRMDPRTLKITPVGEPDEQAPQGAQAWPGTHVFWLKYAYSGSILCHNAKTGKVVDAFVDTDSPVVSVDGTAYAVRSGAVVPLPTSRTCPG
jgi:hypothetical protein